ncbi:(2Fe-2S)-binding protein [Flexibacterium corallicola]|uniref:(2Fe-2S)-binding protein n=1 Tax=Flexibacterium corallicola TaxID=3037259 RepID=UPI00286EC460|nr:(2Fe-2S)-binding protein [Pseudovibrio sp. M1P-2-3]
MLCASLRGDNQENQMIVCHCNVISDGEVRKVAKELHNSREGGLPTPGAVFKCLGKRPKCGGCFKTIINLIYEEQVNSESNAGQ